MERTDIFQKKLPNDFTGTLDVKNGMCEQPQILDDVEREYLSAVIKPFRDKIFVIIKGKSIDKECIHIVSKNYGNMFFPNFPKNTMYKGMELDKRYTLEELGL